MPFVNFTDMLEGMSGRELDAAFQAVLQHIEDEDLRQALIVLPRSTRATLRRLLIEVDRQLAEGDPNPDMLDGAEGTFFRSLRDYWKERGDA